MKTLTVNMWNGGRIWGSLIPFIQKLQPDIIFMQEACDSPRADVEQRFRSTQGSEMLYNIRTIILLQHLLTR
jgi:hypothetical protein